MVAFHLVLQLIPHTRVVPKLPVWIESWMNTPSHHRVHHARNERYLDKNYGGFLIIWDKLFGSYEDETEECSYGVTNPPNTWDPTFINFQVWCEVLRDARDAPSFFEKLRIWFMPTGWRPAGVAERKAGTGLKTMDGKEIKFQSNAIAGSKPYLIVQVLLGFPIMLLVIHGQSPLVWWQKVIVSLVIWAGATSWSAMLESKPWALKLEIARVVSAGLVISGLGAAQVLPLGWVVGTDVIVIASALWVLSLRRAVASAEVPELA